MSRLPWVSYAYRGHGGDEGGMEHLETDVMRFMAILALCLVAIFALVQSMPLDAPAQAGMVAQAEPAAPPAAGQREQVAASTATTAVQSTAPPPEPEVSTRQPLPAPAAQQPVTRTVLVLPASKPRTPPTTREPLSVNVPEPASPTGVSSADPQHIPSATPPSDATTPTPAAQSSQRGFSLRFDSDHALRELVARDAVALYAINRSAAWRVMLVGQRLSFRPAKVPATFHEMAADTVPVDVVTALRRRVTVAPASLRWGVTLPAATTRQLAQFVTAHEAGSLVIDADGGLRLETG